uniref:Uncharacterized protein n=1 Tax=Strongyloides papillosus TaxID=174720 RepID=A0A0N5BRT7_STREA
MSEEKYWIIPSVCTYRDFTKKDFDESIGDTFFKKYKDEQKNDGCRSKNDDVLCKRQESTTSIDSGVEDKESADRYSVGSNSTTSEQGSSTDATKKYKRRSTEELLVRLNEIRKRNENINVKPKPKLQLRNSNINNAIDTSVPADIRLPVDSPLSTRRSSRIISVPNGKMQSKCSVVNIPILSTRRSYSIEKTPVLKKPGILRSNSLRTSSTGMSQLYNSGTPSSKKSTTPVIVAKNLSSKISSFFSNRRSCGGRATSEPPKCTRKSKTTTTEPNISTVKLARTNASYGNNYSRDEVKLKTSKEKIVSIIEKLRR